MAADKTDRNYPWFKLHSKGWLTGTIRANLSIEERSVWADLLAMANESRIRGVICRAEGIPFDRAYIANYLEVPLELLNRTIEKCQSDKNMRDEMHRIEIDATGCLVVTNWDYYQVQKDGKKKRKDIPLAPEDKEASDKAAAARLGYLHPKAAKRGIRHREVEEGVKKATDRIKKMPKGGKK